MVKHKCKECDSMKELESFVEEWGKKGFEVTHFQTPVQYRGSYSTNRGSSTKYAVIMKMRGV